ncbi:hypothetical protein COU56_04425 [Candidatus Pacearchaeota archaeon CG10_big_fil_rev_8_21_14_0_10_31_9]|nr:MAG: hypothetical protein COU56_04425 [Candidatus Pacearchaeota archaeon CG10_big_fil_rev_8_21_14_0_10_31_9]
MKKEASVFLILLVLVSAGAFAQNSGISGNIDNYVKNFIEKGGLNGSSVDQITEIDQSLLPDDVEIKEVDKNKVGIYEVNYTGDSGDKESVYVIMYSTPKLKQKAETKNVQIVVFGSSTSNNESKFLDSSTGVQTGENTGYVMLHSGSLTGISSSSGILEGDGQIAIKIYKNGEDTGFENLISFEDDKKIDYDIQSEGAVSYVAGDIISVYVEQRGNLKWGNVITSVEITS